MKEKKFNLLLNIATLCLCVAAIAFGVYSAKNASLNVSGTVGFNAHNIDYTANLYMYGHSGADGKPVTEANKVTLTNTGSDKINFELGNQTFSDLGDSGEPETIYVVIEVTNNSDFNVALKANLSQCVPSNENLLIDTPKDDSARILASKTGTADARKGTIKYTLNVKKNSNGEYPEIPTTNAVTLKVDLAKTDLTTSTPVRADLPVAVKEFTTEEKNKIKSDLNITSGDCYATKFPYYVEMGERDNNGKVKWLIIGISGTDGTPTALTTEDKTAFRKGLMLNKTYVMLSEKILYTESIENFGISFQNEYKYDDSASPASKNTNNDYSAQDYATSTIRNYLKGKTVQRADKAANFIFSPDGTEVNLLTSYNIKNSKIYNTIQGRTLANLYEGLEDEKHSKAVIWSSDYSGEDKNLIATAEDKLWLLNSVEVTSLLGTESSVIKTSIYASSSGGANWWLRSPSTAYADYAKYITNTGSLFANFVNEAYRGVRPAFLF